jgi:GNAT superfamily N-acetyltransferase
MRRSEVLVRVQRRGAEWRSLKRRCPTVHVWQGFSWTTPWTQEPTACQIEAPDFNALLRLRGRFRTFCAYEGERLVGIATALWDERRDGDATVRVGEFVDLRVASAARGGRAARRLLQKVLKVFEEVDAQWICAVIGDQNRAARRLVEGKAGLPRIVPLTRYVSRRRR